jgi:hypothetical protein
MLEVVGFPLHSSRPAVDSTQIDTRTCLPHEKLFMCICSTLLACHLLELATMVASPSVGLGGYQRRHSQLIISRTGRKLSIWNIAGWSCLVTSSNSAASISASLFRQRGRRESGSRTPTRLCHLRNDPDCRPTLVHRHNTARFQAQADMVGPIRRTHGAMG